MVPDGLRADPQRRGGLPPAGRRLDATYVGAFTVRGGRIAFQQLYHDQVGLQVQLG